MRVLVTGARGYVGAVLCPTLVARGHDVSGVDVGWFEGCDFTTLASVPWQKRDVRVLGAGDLEGFDAVVHLAALSNDPLGERDPQITWEINYEAAVRLARGARAAGVERFVFASSCSVYGALSEGIEANEATPPQPLTAYARAKVAAEEGILALASASFAPAVLRFATAYGSSPRLRLDLVANQFVANAIGRHQIVLLSDGQAWRPLVHVRDMAAAVAAVLEAPARVVGGGLWNVGAEDSNIRIADLAARVAALCPGARVRYPPHPVADRRTYRVSFRAWAEAFPTARVHRALDEGIAELAQSFRERPLSSEELQEGRFERLRVLEKLEREGRLGKDLSWVGEGRR